MAKKPFFFITLIAGIVFFFSSGGYSMPENHPGNTFGPDNNPGNSPNTPGLNSPLNIFNVKGIKSGLVMVDKNYFYTSDVLEVSIVFPRSLTAVWNGSADTYLVIRIPEETEQTDETGETDQTTEETNFMLASFPIKTEGEIPDTPKTFVSLDLSETTLPVGAYQIAMILVKPGGDPLSIEDWYNGFNGLISATDFKVRAECDPLDTNCDGFKDDMELSITPSKITFSLNDTEHQVQVTISEGKPPYSVVCKDTDVAEVVVDNLDDGKFEVKGIAEGTTTITITDSENKIGEVEVEVETEENEGGEEEGVDEE